MKVVFATSELTPIAKVGGLGDVAGALPKSLNNLGVDVSVFMPHYDTIDAKKYAVRDTGRKITVKAEAQQQVVEIHEITIPDSAVPVYLLKNSDFLTGGGIYFEKSAMVGSFAEVKRFLFFSLAVPSALAELGLEPDIIHCQDWHTGLLPLLAKISGSRAKTLFTIHNLANQGKWSAQEILGFLNLAPQKHPGLGLIDGQGDLNLIQQGIVSADFVNTVSPAYAQEILTPEFGYGLEGDLAARGNTLSGILNGIDVARFDPQIDPDIPLKYNAQTCDSGKAAAKARLQKQIGLTVDPDAPLLGFVGRLTDQKGTELLPALLDELLAVGAQVVLLGTGYPQLEQDAQKMAAANPQQVAAVIGFDAKLAQLIYAGSDFFLMPSRFEPCGLGQMIAMRYGTPPIVRAVGGLKDTVTEFDPAAGQGTGFIFADFTSADFLLAVKRALAVFKQPAAYATLKANAMSQDFSWRHSAQQYLDLYQKLIRQ